MDARVTVPAVIGHEMSGRIADSAREWTATQSGTR